MVLPRPATRCFKASHHLPLRISKVPLRPSIWQRSSRRKYSSSAEGDAHGSHKKSSEIPWIIGSVGITLPCVWYLAQPQLNKKPHGGDHGHDSHASGDEHADESHGGEDDAPEAAEAAEEKGSDDSEEKEGGEESDKDGPKEDSDSDSEKPGDDGEKQTEGASDKEQTDEGEEEGDEDKPESKKREYSVTKEKSNSEGLEGVQFKGATKAGKDGKQTHTEKHIPDAKGFNKKRLESDYGKVLGKAEDDEQSADNQDLGAASKSPGDFHTMSGKQEGLANTDTKHSTDITKSSDKSKKGDGSAETSKQKGTVDVNRQLR